VVFHYFVTKWFACAKIKFSEQLPLTLYIKNTITTNNCSKGVRVFPSSQKYFASSRKIQIHWVNTGDSKTVVTPFVQDTN